MVTVAVEPKFVVEPGWSYRKRRAQARTSGGRERVAGADEARVELAARDLRRERAALAVEPLRGALEHDRRAGGAAHDARAPGRHVGDRRLVVRDQNRRLGLVRRAL